MKILVVEPGKHPYAKEIKHELKEMQQIVDGPIQALYPFEDEIGVVCNDEAILLQMPFNRKIAEECYVTGTFFVCGLGRENFDSLSDDLLKNTERCSISRKSIRQAAVMTSRLSITAYSCKDTGGMPDERANGKQSQALGADLSGFGQGCPLGRLRGYAGV